MCGVGLFGFAWSAWSAWAVAAVASGLSVATFAAGCALALYVSFGFGLKGAHAEAVFSCFFVYFYEFDFDFVAFFESGCGHVGESFP